MYDVPTKSKNINNNEKYSYVCHWLECDNLDIAFIAQNTLKGWKSFGFKSNLSK